MTGNKNKKHETKVLFQFFRLVSIIFGFAFLVILIFYSIYFEKIYPCVTIAGKDLSGMSKPQAALFLTSSITPPEEIKLVISQNNFNAKTFKITLADIDFSYNFRDTVVSAYQVGRSRNIIYDISIITDCLVNKKTISLETNLNEQKLSTYLSIIREAAIENPVKPSFKIIEGLVVVDKGKAGKDIDIPKLRTEIVQNLISLKNSSIAVPLKIVDTTLSEEEITSFRQRAQNLIGKSLNITFEFRTFQYKNENLISLLGFNSEINDEKITETLQSLAKDVERSPQNPTFVFLESKVQEFAPAKDGVEVEENKLKKKIIESLVQLQNESLQQLSIEIPTKRTPAKITTSDVNNLGIKELIGRGSSRFRGSIQTRIFNISLASSRLNGLLIEPARTFSFNDALGDVSSFTGYKQAYVIRDGKTILGDGGGVCQVSTTLFRAALNAGLPIAERRAHSYRVGYYEQDSPVGFDATVFGPTTDLKITNDTPGHILIQTSVDPKSSTLVFELYGTFDNRKVFTGKPRISNVTPPPEDLYTDDPSIPLGKIKQVDFKAWGSNVSFDYRVERDGQIIIQKTFNSIYRPWQAVYLRGTGPIN